MSKDQFTYLIFVGIRVAIGFFIIVPLTTHFLDPADFGIFAAVTIVTNLVSPLASFGPSWVLSANFFGRTRQEISDAVTTTFVGTTCLTILTAAVFLALSDWSLRTFIRLPGSEASHYYVMGILGAAFSVPWTVSGDLLVLERRAVTLSLVETGSLIASTVAYGVCFFGLNLGVPTLFVAFLSSNTFLFACAVAIVAPHLAIGRIRRRIVMDFIRLGLSGKVGNLAESLQESAIRFFINRWTALGALGLFSHSTSYRNTFVQAHKAFVRSFGPNALEIFSNGGDVRKLRDEISRYAILLTVGGIFLALFGRDIITLLTHGKFTAATPLVIAWYFLVFSSSFGLAYIQFLIVRKKAVVLAVSTSCTTAGVIFLGAALVYFYGIMGAAITALLVNFSIQLATRMWARKFGCPKAADHILVACAVIVFAAYYLNDLASLAFGWRCLEFGVACALATFAYRFFRERMPDVSPA